MTNGRIHRRRGGNENSQVEQTHREHDRDASSDGLGTIEDRLVAQPEVLLTP